jgi:hypothetical protein
MSHLALRRVVIRLLHDPTLVEALHGDPSAIGDAGLSAAERAWLVAVPRAAWRTDAGRPGRVLAALVDEFPASVALAPAKADGFFGSAAFHIAVQERGSLAAAFAAHLAADADPRLAALARLEAAIAAVRREPPRVAPTGAGRVRLTPHARLLRVAAGAATLLAAVRAGARHGALGPADEPVLVLRAPGDAVTIEVVPPDLAALLERATSAPPRADLERLARSRGASVAEAVEIVDGLVADALLV